ncbi:DUF2059 domain-containing protein [Sandaracinobacter sp. RS1-74]|uniref:DUF2059 domain-containing protein n=1 Tax=Sandaracinobacteroides sayramensis TaxID=2913411 RepID=UPI001ED9D7FE|nr:DUF2059 domain-containing protein [Sandaracinobacteroides sayramensis]MCG2841836.1 DUF2059 domain-containing protein [Sandaracinobacteroides sayramensis]
MTRFQSTLKAGTLPLAALLLSASLALPAQAQSAEATKAATALVEVLMPAAAAKAQLDRQIQQMRSGAGLRAMLSNDPRLKAELAKNSPATTAGLARIGAMQADTVAPIMREMQASARQEQIASFARNFTAEELTQIAAFYRTPAGAKFLSTQGTVAQEVAKANAQKFGPRLQAAEKSVAPKLDAELRKLFPAQAGGK